MSTWIQALKPRNLVEWRFNTRRETDEALRTYCKIKGKNFETFKTAMIQEKLSEVMLMIGNDKQIKDEKLDRKKTKHRRNEKNGFREESRER